MRGIGSFPTQALKSGLSVSTIPEPAIPIEMPRSALRQLRYIPEYIGSS